MTDSLLQLEARLMSSFGTATGRMNTWTSADVLAPTLRSIQKIFDSPAIRAGRESISAAVLRFRNTLEIPTFKDLRYICAGATLELDGWYLVGDQRLWRVLSSRASEADPRKRLKSYQSLLRSYWSFPAQVIPPTAEAYKGWSRLREWLNIHFDQLHSSVIADGRIRTPQWFATLAEHRNLLTSDPCGRYGPSLLSGDSTLLDAATEGLAIPSDSWVFEEAVLSQVRHCTAEGDEAFLSKLSAVLDLVLLPRGRQMSRSLATRCVACLISRYSRCSSRPEHVKLRDGCLELIGNPWLRKPAWDAHVLLPSGVPDDSARELVHTWLRTRLIKDFFELLTEERAADQRRLDFWLRFEESISDMWFILGSNASSSNEREFTEFRKRARGRILSLAGQTVPANNAFVMVIGDHVVIEFGVKGNACYVFAWEDLPSSVRKKLTSSIQGLEIEIGDLRHGGRLKRLIHLDSPTSLVSWEEKFDHELLPLLNATPSGPPYSLRRGRHASAPTIPLAARPIPGVGNGNRTIHAAPSYPAAKPLFSWTDLERHVAKHHLKVLDHRRKGGSYWVLLDNTLPELTNPLRAWGFKYKPGKGWWRE